MWGAVFGLFALAGLCGVKEVPGVFSVHDCKGGCLMFPLGKILKDAVAVNLALGSVQ